MQYQGSLLRIERRHGLADVVAALLRQGPLELLRGGQVGRDHVVLGWRHRVDPLRQLLEDAEDRRGLAGRVLVRQAPEAILNERATFISLAFLYV